MKKALLLFLQVSLCTVSYLYASSKRIQAQVTTDGTVNTQVNQNGNVAEITGGETRGSNLFHSFQDFSIPNGNEASFLNTNDISNIFSRVTGGSASNIDGVVRANGNASLFLINPAGIIFGENARLDIGGSFLGSTSNSILFPDGVNFSADDLQVNPVLTVNAPIGLGFRDNPGDIVNLSRANNDRGLEVDPGNNLSLLGGNISFDGGIITASGGIVNLGGLAAAGEIGLNKSSSLSFPGGVERADISLVNDAEVNVIDEIGGSININARNLELLKNSTLISGTQEGNQTTGGQAGDIKINATSDVSIVESRLENEVKENATGNSGNIEITAQSIFLSEGIFLLSENTLLSTLSTQTLGNGNGGDIIINALDSVSLDGSEIETEVESVSFGTGTGGSISIDTNDLNLDNGAVIQAGTESEKNAGDIRINASNSVFLNSGIIENQVDADSSGNAGIISINANNAISVNNSFINSRVNEDAIGNSGGIDITTGNLSIISSGGSNNAGLTASTEGQGNSGLIRIQATEEILLDGSFVSSRVASDGIADSSGIEISANNLTLSNGASINSPTEGQGNAGIIRISANDTISINNSFIISIVNENAIGSSDGIDITTGNLSIISSGGSNNAGLTASTEGQGNSGLIRIQATEEILLDGSFINSQVEENGAGDSSGIEIISKSLKTTGDSRILSTTETQGNAGDIKIRVQSISLSENSLVSSQTEGNGDGGDIIINALDSVSLDGSEIETEVESVSFGTGTGGSISIDTSDLNLDNGAVIQAGTESEKNAGDIRINASNSVFLNSGIIENRAENNSIGDSGEIEINTNNLSLINGSSILASSEGQGDPGNISITADSIQLDRGDIIAETFFSRGGEISGGEITLTIEDNLTLRNNSTISAQAFGNADGGNVSIDSRFLLAFPDGNNDILASAEQGQGGNISFDAQGVLGLRVGSQNNQTNDIDATGAIDGEVNFFLPDINVFQGLLETPRNLIISDQTTQQVCETNRVSAAMNDLTISGKGGVVPDPALPLNSLNLYPQPESTSTQFTPALIQTSKGKIQPARGVKVTESGEIILTAYRTNNSGDRIPETRNCV